MWTIYTHISLLDAGPWPLAYKRWYEFRIQTLIWVSMCLQAEYIFYTIRKFFHTIRKFFRDAGLSPLVQAMMICIGCDLMMICIGCDLFLGSFGDTHTNTHTHTHTNACTHIHAHKWLGQMSGRASLPFSFFFFCSFFFCWHSPQVRPDIRKKLNPTLFLFYFLYRTWSDQAWGRALWFAPCSTTRMCSASANTTTRHSANRV